MDSTHIAFRFDEKFGAKRIAARLSIGDSIGAGPDHPVSVRVADFSCEGQ